MEFDVDLMPRNVQELNNPDGIAAFFSNLGYNTDERTIQTPENLGISAESTIRPIRHIELIASQEGLLQIYLFELTSVTVSQTRALARAFRNRAGNYLLVLTSDYERIDFVLIERYSPPATAESTGIGQRQVGVRPRALTIDRRKPSTVHIRVLKRFSYTESDPFAQYDKLLAAYSIAEWSEEFFNNRALFSDYYLMNRMPQLEEWSEDPKPTFLRLCELYSQATARYAGKGEELLRKQLLEPAFEVLGFRVEVGKKANSEKKEADYRLFSPENGEVPVANCLVYSWGRFLDGKDNVRDDKTPEENPGAWVVSLLEQEEAPWAIVTNGKLWRLYSRRARSRSTNYYEIDLEETLAQSLPQAQDIAVAFRYFWLLFRSDAFLPTSREAEDGEVGTTYLDRLLDGSDEYARELGERLKERVFEDVFPHIAEGFITYIRSGDAATTEFTQEILDSVFQGTLTFLYRILFLLYAEARDLLPVREVRGYFGVSLKKIKEEIAETAGALSHEAAVRIKKTYSNDNCEFYERLEQLFRIVDRGEPALNIPPYNGGLFLSEPDENDTSPEAINARFLGSTMLPNRHLALALDLLSRDADSKRGDLVFIDYKSLGVRQLGSIYEGLLEFKLRMAPEKMAVVKGKKTEEVLLYREAVKKGLKPLKEGKGKSASEKVIRKGQMYLENDRRERKATGSYYTPDFIVEYIVQNVVGPVLDDKFDQIRPMLRKAQQDRRAFFKKQEALRDKGIRPEPDSKAEPIGSAIVEEFFNIKVLDPAMGSGHFLVEAVDYITDRSLDFLNSFPWNPILSHLSSMRETIFAEMDEKGIAIDRNRLTDINLLKRHVLKKCVYGVDLNPMAVELTKVSLWLDCFTLGAPLSFLDHHIKCGNSLVGVSVEEVRKKVESAQSALWGSQFTGLMLATDLMHHIGDLSDATSTQVQESRMEYRKATDALAPFKEILNVFTSRWFGNTPRQINKGKKAEEFDPTVDFLQSPESETWIKDSGNVKDLGEANREVAEIAVATHARYRLFHWELEFPEVFFEKGERKDDGGFEVVVGNPPYDVLASKELGRDISDEQAFFAQHKEYEPSFHGKNNLYKLFICRCLSLLSPHSAMSFIVPMALLGDTQATGVRKVLLQDKGLIRIEAFPQKDDPNNRVFPEAKLATTIFVTSANPSESSFCVRTHPGRYVVPTSPCLAMNSDEVLRFDPEDASIPSCPQRDWDIAMRIMSTESVMALRKVPVKSYQGEVNETNERERDAITCCDSDPLVLHGSNITMYAVRSASQGEDIHLNIGKFLAGKGKDSKAYAFRSERVGFQRSSPQNNFRRIIAARIPRNSFCLDTVSYITEESSAIDLDLLLAFLNSKILDWFFRLRSTNSKVNEYQFNALPMPTTIENGDVVQWENLFEQRQWDALSRALCDAIVNPGEMNSSVTRALSGLCRYIQDVEGRRIMRSRSERAFLTQDSQDVQDVIDAVLCRCYGLDENEATYIYTRLREML